MLLTPDRKQLLRPMSVAVRGAAITMIALLAYLWMRGATLQDHQGSVWPYLMALALSFVLHYLSASYALNPPRADGKAR